MKASLKSGHELPSQPPTHLVQARRAAVSHSTGRTPPPLCQMPYRSAGAPQTRGESAYFNTCINCETTAVLSMQLLLRIIITLYTTASLILFFTDPTPAVRQHARNPNPQGLLRRWGGGTLEINPGQYIHKNKNMHSLRETPTPTPPPPPLRQPEHTRHHNSITAETHTHIRTPQKRDKNPTTQYTTKAEPCKTAPPVGAPLPPCPPAPRRAPPRPPQLRRPTAPPPAPCSGVALRE